MAGIYIVLFTIGFLLCTEYKDETKIYLEKTEKPVPSFDESKQGEEFLDKKQFCKIKRNSKGWKYEYSFFLGLRTPKIILRKLV